jgi:hypothetical protein
MTFRQYLQTRLRGERGALDRGIAALCAIEDWPDIFENWYALRAWLISVDTRSADIRTAGGAWVSYERFLKAQGLEMPRPPSKPAYGLPRGVQAVTEAPELVRLSKLGHALRKVGWQAGPGDWHWCGDLTDPDEFRIYRHMRDVDATLIQLSRYPYEQIRYPVLFARIKAGVDPAKAYQAATGRVRQEANAKETALRVRHSYGKWRDA